MRRLVISLAIAVAAYGQGGPPGSLVDPTRNGPTDVTTTAAEKAAATTTMLNWVKNKYNLSDPTQQFKAHELVKDTNNVWHGKLDQVSRGIPVRSGHLNITLENGAVSEDRVHGDFLDDADTVDIQPKLNPQKAIAIVKQLVRAEIQKQGGPKTPQEKPDKNLLIADGAAPDRVSLEIHPGGGKGNRKLSHHVSVEDHSAAGPVLMEAWLDQDGNVLEAYNNAQTGVYSGRGGTFYQGYQGLGYGWNYFYVDYWGAYNVYVLNDNSARFGAFDMYGTTGSTYQASVPGGSGPYFGNTLLSNRNTTNSDAYWSTIQTWSFMYWVLGRDFVDGARGPKVYNSVDGLGPLVSARNHYGVSYNNAFWDGQKINLGDGNGITFRTFATLDIIGHEWTHGLTQYTAGLNYSYEPGALNEAFSDIFGSMAERYWYGESLNTWKIGEGAYTPATAGDALRRMDAPWLQGQPWNYSQRYIGTADNGGVHTNSGIANFAFYTLAKGWSGSVGAIGADAATKIFYRALRYYMIPTDGYYWARRCTQWAAGDLYGYGSYQYNQTVAAWNFVGAP